jgi:hypothetical protein
MEAAVAPDATHAELVARLAGAAAAGADAGGGEAEQDDGDESEPPGGDTDGEGMPEEPLDEVDEQDLPARVGVGDAAGHVTRAFPPPLTTSFPPLTLLFTSLPFSAGGCLAGWPLRPGRRCWRRCWRLRSCRPGAASAARRRRPIRRGRPPDAAGAARPARPARRRRGECCCWRSGCC